MPLVEHHEYVLRCEDCITRYPTMGHFLTKSSLVLTAITDGWSVEIDDDGCTVIACRCPKHKEKPNES